MIIWQETWQGMLKYLPHTHMIKCAKSGEPIYVDRVGSVDHDKLATVATKEDLIHGHLVMMEFQVQYLRKIRLLFVHTDVLCHLVDTFPHWSSAATV